MADKFVDVRLSAEGQVDFALDLVSDAYADQAMVDRLKEKYRGEAGSSLVNQLRRRCYIPIELPHRNVALGSRLLNPIHGFPLTRLGSRVTADLHCRCQPLACSPFQR